MRRRVSMKRQTTHQVTQRDFSFRLYADVKQDRCAEIDNTLYSN